LFFFVMFGRGDIVVSVVEMENEYDIRFRTLARSCGFKRSVLFQWSKHERICCFWWRLSDPVIHIHQAKKSRSLEASQVNKFIFLFWTFKNMFVDISISTNEEEINFSIFFFNLGQNAGDVARKGRAVATMSISCKEEKKNPFGMSWHEMYKQ